jgi:DNA-binding GntR family transcriptional regulator
MPSAVETAFPIEVRREGETVQEWAYRQLRQAIMRGRIVPGRSLTIRGVAEALGVSPMPVREALRRLVAERALDLPGNRRVHIPFMSPARFEELCEARVALETLAAERALPAIGPAGLRRLREIDTELDTAIAAGDVDEFVIQNQAFHLYLYGAGASEVLIPLIESLWLQFGPFMRMAIHSLGKHYLVDRHKEAIAAIEREDAHALRIAIEADIRDGMAHLGRTELLKNDRA